MRPRRMDVRLLVSILVLVGAGFLIFLSASLGLLARDSVHFGSIAFKQLFFGLLPGLIGLYIFSRIDYLYWRKWSFWFFVFAIFLNLAIFVPGLGLHHGGAVRWLIIGPISLQTSEVLKIAVVMYYAAWLAMVGERTRELKWGFLPLLALVAIAGILCLLEPDTDTFVIIAASLVAMFVSAGGKWRYIGALAVAGILGLGLLALVRPYVMARIKTFIDPASASAAASYQIEQSLIAVGSGSITGRGFGQSIQKFNYLPEPVGDSIFAVAAEEFGFIGACALVGLYIYFALRSLKVAESANHRFGTYLGIGITAFIVVQSFTNIGSMVDLMPLSGVPLLFVSQGGTALLFVLAESGILLNISRTAKLSR